jgi:hypothetical protein
MAEKDQSAWLPEPPPPRPARRDAAIEAALRKFDGSDEPAAAPQRPRASWPSRHRPAFAALVSATLLVIIGVPAAIIGLRNAPSPSERPAPQVAMRNREPPAPLQSAAPPAETTAEAPPSETKPAAAAPQPATASRQAQQQLEAPAAEAPAIAPVAPVIAAAPPPPAPPPPPPPAPQAVADAGQAKAQNIVVTGSRIAESERDELSAAKAISPEQANARFLAKLQAAVHSNNRGAIVKLVGLPLRVNFAGGARVYRDRKWIERDFDQIFTAKVRNAILAQRSDRLFVRDQGAMIGDGEVWFRESCPIRACSPAGPLRIVAINP